MRPTLLALMLLAGCADPSGPADGGASDAGMPDSGAACSGTEILVDVGHCFEARRCCEASDCGAERSWECTAEGRCQPLGRTCGCIDDLDCAGGELCFTNAVVCGICMPTTDPCATDSMCSLGRCATGYCVDDTMCIGYSTP